MKTKGKAFANKKVLTIFAMTIMMVIGSITYGVILANKEDAAFSDSGYVLLDTSSREANTQNGIYFESGVKYKTKYPEKVTFKDKEGDNATINNTSFMHYQNGNVSSFVRGVFLNADRLDDKNISYYNITAGSQLRKKGNVYEISQQKNELDLSNVIWKISDTKYLILSSEIQIAFAKDNKKTVNDYIELNFIDKDIALLVHQQGTYQTIAEDAYLQLANGIKIHLNDRSVSKNDKEKMSLTDMIIHADDNIVTIDKEKEETKKDDKADVKDENNNGNQNSNNSNQTNNSTTDNKNNNVTVDKTDKDTADDKKDNNGGSGSKDDNGNGGNNDNNGNNGNGGNNNGNTGDNGNGGNNGDNGNGGNNGDNGNTGKDDDEEAETKKQFPSFAVTDLKAGVISVNAAIEITDDDDLLTSDTVVKIVERGSNKTIYENKMSLGIYNISVMSENLKPDTEYLLIANAEYSYNDETYNKDFVSQVFKTDSLGISFDKSYISEDTIAVRVKAENYSSITDGQLELYDIVNNELLNTQTINMKVAKQENNYVVKFEGLEHNHEYELKLTNLLYDSSIVMEFDEVSKSFKTLKTPPTIGEAIVAVNKKDSKASLSLKLENQDSGVLDNDNGISSIQYEIYMPSQIDADTGLPNSKPIKTVSKNAYTGIDVNFDGTTLQRKVAYTFRVVVNFADNEKEVEYMSGYSQPFSLDTNEFPSVHFNIQKDADGNEIGIRSESITGTISIDDAANMLLLNKNVKVSISANDGTPARSKAFTYVDRNQTFAINEQQLKQNTTYFFSVYATINDGSGVTGEDTYEAYIGGFSITTKANEEVNVTLKQQKPVDQQQSFDYMLKLNDTEVEKDGDRSFEAKILSAITLSLYEGENTEGSPIAQKTIYAEEVGAEDSFDYDNPETNLKEELYDNSYLITPELFGETSQSLGKDRYTLVVESAIDYTQHQNAIPLTNGVEEDELCKFTITTHGFVPSLPPNVNNAINAAKITNIQTTESGDYYKKIAHQGILNNDTIVGLDVQENSYPAAGMKYANAITYRAYNVEADGSTVEIASKTIDVNDTTATKLPNWLIDFSEEGCPFKRGERYYFTYSVDMNLSKPIEGSDPINAVYPTDAPGYTTGLVLRSRQVDCPKQMPTMQTVQTSSETVSGKVNSTWKYTLRDIDGAFTISDIKAYVGDKVNQTALFRQPSDQENVYTVTLSGLALNSSVKLKKDIQLFNQEAATEFEILTHVIPSTVASNTANMRYSLIVTNSKLKINISNTLSNTALQDLVAVKAVISAPGKKSVTIDYLPLASEASYKSAEISLLEIKEFLQSTIQVDLYGYYASNVTGTAVSKDNQPFVLQEFNPVDNTFTYHNEAEDTLANGSIYSLNGTTEFTRFESNYFNVLAGEGSSNFKVSNLHNTAGLVKYAPTLTLTKGFAADRQGMNTKTNGSSVENSKYYIFRKLEQSKLAPVSTNIIDFDYIIPTVENVKVEVALIDAKLTFLYDGIDKSTIKGNKLYVEFTDATGTKPIGSPVEIENVTGKNEVEKLLTGLKKDTTYYFRIYALFENNSSSVKKYLVDETNANGVYSFKTRNNIGLTMKSSPYRYVSKTYEKKQMEFYFNVNVLNGYYLEYTLVDTADKNTVLQTGQVGKDGGFFLVGETNTLVIDTSLNSELNKKLVYGHTYTLKIQAKTITSDEPLTTDVQSVSFRLKALDDPVVYATATSSLNKTDTKKADITLNLTIADRDLAMVDSEYYLELRNNENKTIYTSGTYKLRKYAGEDEVIPTMAIKVALDGNKLDINLEQDYTIYLRTKINSAYQTGSEKAFSWSTKIKTLNANGVAIGKAYANVVTKDSTRVLQLSLYDTNGFSSVKKVNYSIIDMDNGSTILSVMNEEVTYGASDPREITLAQSLNTLEDGRYAISIQYTNASGNVLVSDSVEFNINSSFLGKVMQFFGWD